MKIKSFYYFIGFFLLVFSLMFVEFCTHDSTRESEPIKHRDFDSIIESDTLHVVLECNSINYFVYKGNPIGLQYELVQSLCSHFKLFPNIKVINNMEKAFQELAFGQCDLIAMELAVAEGRYPRIAFTTPMYKSHSVLVQKNGKNLITTLEQLDNKTVYISKKTIHAEDLRHLKDSLNLNLKIIETEEEGDEFLCNLVDENHIEYTVCDINLAKAIRNFYPNLNFDLKISKPHQVAWAVNSKSVVWLEKLNEWISNLKKSGKLNFLKLKYIDNPVLRVYDYTKEKTGFIREISKYDAMIKDYCKSTDWDWRLVSSLVFQESRFNPNTVSPSGAFGIMQIMPITGRQLGIDQNSSVEDQLKAGIRLLQYMDSAFAPYVSNKEERQKIVIAAYNLGMVHFFDAFELIKKYDKSPITYKLVFNSLKRKRQPKFYNDPVVKYGYLNPWYVNRFVTEVYARYNAYCAVFPEK